jgi:hypothetical protein
MKRSNALTRGIFKRSIGTIALIQRSGMGKSGSGTTRGAAARLEAAEVRKVLASQGALLDPADMPAPVTVI